MFRKIIAWFSWFFIGGNNDNSYPLPDRLKEDLPHPSSLLLAMDFKRDVKKKFDLSQGETEFLLYLLLTGPTFEPELYDAFDHFSKKYVKQLIRELHEDGLIDMVEEPIVNKPIFNDFIRAKYFVTRDVENTIKHLYSE